MASAVKRQLARATGRSTPDSEERQETEQYRLLVTAGSSYDPALHKVVHVNTNTATVVENDFVTAKIKVRIRSYRGLPSSCPSHSPYFDDPVHAKDQYSVAFSFVPKQDIPSVDTVWGNDFDHPVRDRLPPGFNTAFKIVKEFIDPGLECDAYADQPWLYGPSLSCWFAFRVGDEVSSNKSEDFPAPQEEQAMIEGGSETGQTIRQKLKIPDDNEKRRKHFLSAQNREAFTFEKGRLYQGDFYNPYLDFGNFALKLPGFTLKVIKYVDQKSHCLRYVFKNRRTGEVYFNVNMNLLWGEKLQRALREDEEQSDTVAGAEMQQEDDGVGMNGGGGGEEEVPEIANPQYETTKSTAPEPVPSDSKETPRSDRTLENGVAGVGQSTRRLHPGSQSALADYDPGVEEITNLLNATATVDKRGSGERFLT